MKINNMNLKPYLLLLLIVFLTSNRYAFAQNKPGFVQQENIKVAGITTDAQIYPLSNMQKQTTRSYYDGMGRVVQAIGIQASPAGNDLIQPVAYDNLGRQTISYLPYAGSGLSTDTIGSYRSNAIAVQQPAFYNQTTQYVIPVDASPFAQQVFENSPMQRTLLAGSIGSNFQPVSGQHYKSLVYRYNKTADGNILVWNPDGSFTAGNYYAANTLAVTDGKDEDGVETLGFTDVSGHVILKRQILPAGNLDTYYIYNAAGMISYILPPKAIALMASAGSYAINTVTGVNKLYFHFIYDGRGRLAQKIVPAKGVMYIVYDPLNRPVLMQDSNMRVNKNWNYVKYDVKGRPISQGIYYDASNISLTQMQNYVNGVSYATWYESRTAAGTTTGYYTNSVFPTASTTPLAYAYYDDYDLLRNGIPYTYVHKGLANEDSVTTAYTKGAPTMVWRTTVGAGLSGTWLLKVTFYDKRGNPIQTRSNNHLYYSGSTTLTDCATTVPDFAGVPQTTLVSVQSASATTNTVQTTPTYDQVYRVKTVSQAYNSATAVQIAAYTYSEAGQLVKKGLGYNGTTYLQNVNMRYNIRGQLLYINNSTLANDTGKTSNDTNDLFGMQLLYDNVDANLNNKPSYNGKVSAVKWMSSNGLVGGTSYERAFKYYYDALDRDTAAIYAERPAGSSRTTAFTTTHGWDENRITYDQNGNIQTLFRNSALQGTGAHTPIDNLTYTYAAANPDQLASVADATGNSAGFMAGAGSYSYDGNGNLMSDPYKGLTFGAYDVLNRTDKITLSAGNYITYTYDAGGNLIRKQQYESGALFLQTDYIGGFVFLTKSGATALSYFPMPEGRVLWTGTAFTQEYIIADQQGNARVSINNSGTGGAAIVVQENSYYAFGMVMPGSAVGIISTDNKHLYNGGSEWQNDYTNLPDYYQTFNRNYDAALGRFVGVDPIAESAESMTSYQYAGNNPVMMNDPMGDLLRQSVPAQAVSIDQAILNNINGAFLMSGGGSSGGGGDDWQDQGIFANYTLHGHKYSEITALI